MMKYKSSFILEDNNTSYKIKVYSKEKGEKYFDMSADNLAAFANEIKKIDVEIKDRHYDTRSWEY